MNTAWIESNVVEEDLRFLSEHADIPWEKLHKKTILITGGTGLIGKNLIQTLLYINELKKADLRVIAYVRDEKKARSVFKMAIDANLPLMIIEGTIEENVKIKESVDYVIHGASPTASSFFLEHPVETIHTIMNGTEYLLRLAKEKKSKGFVFLSSMEAYGSPKQEKLLKETDESYINTMNPRNCYPEAKRMAEMLCTAYVAEYGVRACCIRLAQTFGAGVDSTDKRAFAEFARCAMRGEDIVLKTDGQSKHPYLYTADAVSAIFTALLKGEPGKVYNASNPSTYGSIVTLAETAVKVAGRDMESKVIIACDKEAMKKYPDYNVLNMDCSELEKLGWKAVHSLDNMYERMIAEGRL